MLPCFLRRRSLRGTTGCRAAATLRVSRYRRRDDARRAERRDRGRRTTGDSSWSRKPATKVVVRVYFPAAAAVFERPRDDDRFAVPFFFCARLLLFRSFFFFFFCFVGPVAPSSAAAAAAAAAGRPRWHTYRSSANSANSTKYDEYMTIPYTKLGRDT